MTLYGAVPWLYTFWRFILFWLNLCHIFFLNYYVCVALYCIVLFCVVLCYVVLCYRREWNGLWSRLTVEKTTQRKLLRSLSKLNTTQSILYIIIWFTSVFSISLLISLFVLSHLSFLSYLFFLPPIFFLFILPSFSLLFSTIFSYHKSSHSINIHFQHRDLLFFFSCISFYFFTLHRPLRFFILLLEPELRKFENFRLIACSY